MDDVIFAGTEKRPALGRAEVSLTLDNSSGLLPVEFNEVTLTRILFRSGESEYAINGAPCRLLDLQELLSDAGVGRQQHVIVSQGQIDAVLNARPEDRRAIIEEAAGVLKYRRRKEKAERRLDATEANLLRLQDLLREVRRQLRPLERQAEAARRHEELVRRARRAAGVRRRSRDHVVAPQAGVDRGRPARCARSSRASSSRRWPSSTPRSCRSRRSCRRAVRATSATASCTSSSCASGRAAWPAILAERKRSLERDHGQLLDAGVVANLEGRRRPAARRARRGRRRARAGRSRGRGADRRGAGVRRRACTLRRVVHGRPTMTARRRRVRPPRCAASCARSATASSAARASCGGSTTDGEALRARLEQLAAEADRLRADCAGAESVETPLVAEVEQAEARRGAGRGRRSSAPRTRATTRPSRPRARTPASRRCSWRSMPPTPAPEPSGWPASTACSARCSTWSRSTRAGKQPVEAALGEALTAVVVDGDASARRALATLRDSDTSGAVLAIGGRGAARVVPAGRVDRCALTSAPAARACRACSTRCSAAPCGSTTSTRRSRPRSPIPAAVIVTADGDRLAPTGWRVGAAAGGATAAALDDARQRATAAADGTRCRRAARWPTSRAALDAAREHEQSLNRRLDQNDARFTAASEGLARVLGHRRELQAELESLDRVDRRPDRPHRRRAGADHRARGRAPGARRRRAGRGRRRARPRRGDAPTSKRGPAVLASRRRELEVRNAGLHERQQFLEQRIAETERRLEADVEARARAADRRQEIERSLVAIERLARLVAAHRR